MIYNNTIQFQFIDFMIIIKVKKYFSLNKSIIKIKHITNMVLHKYKKFLMIEKHLTYYNYESRSMSLNT